MRGVRRVFRLSTRRASDVDAEVDEELAFHLAMREAKLRAQGYAPADARRIARDRFGDLSGIRDDCLRESHPLARSERTMQWFEEARRDSQFAVRSLLRAKGFAAAVILTLALGIGAGTTIFSLINAVVLNPIRGVRDAGTLFQLSEVVSHPAFRDLRERLPGLSLTAIRERRVALGNGVGVEHTLGGLVSGSFFDVVGAEILLGRPLHERDDQPGAPPVGVLSYEYWSRALARDLSIVGRSLTVNGAPVAIVGVAAPEFRGLQLGAEPAIWLPLQSWSSVGPASTRRDDLGSPNREWIRVMGRTSAGMTFEQAHAALVSAMRGADPTATPAALRERAQPRSVQAAALTSDAREAVVRFSAILAAVVALVLLTACANIAGLLLSKAVYREREIAVRVSLGAGRTRLVRQLVTESLVLAGAGGCAGLALFLGARAFLARLALPADVSAGAIDLALDWKLLAFATGVTILTGLLFGVMPAIQATRPDPIAALRGGAAQGRARVHFLRGGLVTAQVAVGLVLLIGTGLFTRALTRAFAVDLGFSTEHLAGMGFDPALAQLEPARAPAYVAAVTERVAAVPGISGVTWTAAAPLSSDHDRGSAHIQGYTPAPGERVMLEWNIVGPRYHEVFGIPMVSGRGFDERDAAGQPPVIVVNETLARRYFPGRSAVGSAITMDGVEARIIGVARDIKYHALNEEPRPYVYIPLLQLPPGAGMGSPILILRASGDPASVLTAAVQAAQSANPAVPVFGAATMSSRLNALVAPQLAGAWLLGVFSTLALVVASVGIYGIVAYTVSQRTRDIGIRMALGARAATVVREVIAANLAFVALGVLLGLALALLLARGLTAFLFGVTSSDLVTLATASGIMLAIGLVASVVPARRAARIDPLQALRA